jgi:biotin carboxyl carrier protein
MSARTRLLFFVTAWAIVLMPFLFWRSTWFGRQLSDQQIGKYLHDDSKPREMQHALVQIGERMSRGRSAAQWYPDLLRLASHPVEEIRTTDAWLMGQDASRPEFHQALLTLLQDESHVVRHNAALALVRFGDTAGHDEIVSMLAPVRIQALTAGHVSDLAHAGASVRRGATIARIEEGNVKTDVLAPIAGRVTSVAARPGDTVGRGAELASISPSADQLWEALRALYLIGTPADLPAVSAYERPSADVPERVQQQAALTADAIRKRSAR